MTEIRFNVKNNFKEDGSLVFGAVADYLRKSFGPHGSTTIIENNGSFHITKDGWNILKEIKAHDHFTHAILNLITDISQQVVVKVGDSSTTSIIAAHKLFDMLNVTKISGVRPRDLMEKLDKVTKRIVAELEANATYLDKEDYGKVFDIAKVSTNGDELIAKMIRSIYEETNNPSIEYVKGLEHATTYEVVEGYRAGISYIDRIFAPSDSGEVTVDAPFILSVDNEMSHEEHLEILEMALDAARLENRRLVVTSPRFDSLLRSYIKQRSTHEYQNTGKTSAIYARVQAVNNDQMNQYNDFILMAGGTIIDYAFTLKFRDTLYERGEDGRLTRKDAHAAQEAHDMVREALGYVDKLQMNGSHTTISGFSNRNEAMYAATLGAARSEVKKHMDAYKEFNSVNAAMYRSQTRLSKLLGTMGVISVGGPSPLERDATYDLVEDAVKACESAYRHGYNLGGSLAIPIAIDSIYKKDADILTDVDKQLYEMIREAFKDVYFCVLDNSYGALYNEDQALEKEEKFFGIYKESIARGKCFDLVTEEYSDTIINSAQADMEVLKASLSIVSLFLTSNQYVTNSTDIFSTVEG